jgi:hypothetical protein
LSALSELLISEVIWEMLSANEEVSQESVLSCLCIRMLAEWDEKRCYAYVTAIRELKYNLNEKRINLN